MFSWRDSQKKDIRSHLTVAWGGVDGQEILLRVNNPLSIT